MNILLSPLHFLPNILRFIPFFIEFVHYFSFSHLLFLWFGARGQQAGRRYAPQLAIRSALRRRCRLGLAFGHCCAALGQMEVLRFGYPLMNILSELRHSPNYLGGPKGPFGLPFGQLFSLA